MRAVVREGSIFKVRFSIIAVFLLKQFDKISGRGPKQVSDGIKKYEEDK